MVVKKVNLAVRARHLKRAKLKKYFNLDPNSFARTKDGQRSKGVVNTWLMRRPNVNHFDLNLTEIEQNKQFFTTSQVPVDDYAGFPLLYLNDIDNHSGLTPEEFNAEFANLQKILLLPNSLTVKSTNGKGLHIYNRLIVTPADRFCDGNLIGRIGTAEYLKHLINIRDTAINYLLAQNWVSIGFDLMGSPAVYVRDSKTFRHQIYKFGDLVRIAPEILAMSEAEWAAEIADVSLESYINDTQRLIDLLDDPQVILDKIEAYRSNFVKAHGNAFMVPSPFVVNKVIEETPVVKLARESMAERVTQSKSRKYYVPSQFKPHFSRFYNHDWDAIRTQTVSYRQEGKQKSVVSEERFGIVASALLAGSVIAENNKGEYKNTVPKAFVKGIIAKWHELGLSSIKYASDTEIKIVESFLIRWGLLEVIDNTYRFGVNGIACKYKCLIDLDEKQDTESKDEDLCTHNVKLTPLGISLYKQLFTKYYHRKYLVFAMIEHREAG